MEHLLIFLNSRLNLFGLSITIHLRVNIIVTFVEVRLISMPKSYFPRWLSKDCILNGRAWIKYLPITRISTYIVENFLWLSWKARKKSGSSEKDHYINNIKLQMLPTGKMWPGIGKYDQTSKTRRKWKEANVP